MESLNNPASRLLSIIKDGQQKSNTIISIDIWSEILSVPKENRALLLRRIGYVMALPLQIREKIYNIDNIDPKTYLKWLPRVENSFNMLNFQVPWKTFINNFDGTVMYGMEVCADLLSRRNPDKTWV